MKICSVVGIRKSGKTTVVTELIKELKKRGYRAGTVKTVFCPAFSIDDPKSNTARHMAAGADLVCARAKNETTVIYPKGMEINELYPKLNLDYLIVEGDYEAAVPRIVCAHTEEEIAERANANTIAISGRIAGKSKEQNAAAGEKAAGENFRHLPVYNVFTEITKLTDLVEQTQEITFPIELLQTPGSVSGFCQCGCHKNEKKRECQSLKAHPDGSGRLHIFLTGEKQIGKSTILRKLLDKARTCQIDVVGYETRKYAIEGMEKGYYLHSLLPMREYENDSPVVIRTGERKMIPVTETFETLGVEILKQCAGKQAVICMDEIGKAEKKAESFQKEIFRCLDRELLVTGVLQKTDQEFIRAIQSRPDVCVYEITKENRDNIYSEIEKQMFRSLSAKETPEYAKNEKTCYNIKIGETPDEISDKIPVETPDNIPE
ncbi:MAG: molybdopterin-guanine dinucleotide biosynthesis protein MobB [Eubacteriales bacterium]|nr:molybdopterin-guanine dinucleotide biosynthesis protein MobB [Eubacteriales bacterium]